MYVCVWMWCKRCAVSVISVKCDVFRDIKDWHALAQEENCSDSVCTGHRDPPVRTRSAWKPDWCWLPNRRLHLASDVGKTTKPRSPWRQPGTAASSQNFCFKFYITTQHSQYHTTPTTQSQVHQLTTIPNINVTPSKNLRSVSAAVGGRHYNSSPSHITITDWLNGRCTYVTEFRNNAVPSQPRDTLRRYSLVTLTARLSDVTPYFHAHAHGRGVRDASTSSQYIASTPIFISYTTSTCLITPLALTITSPQIKATRITKSCILF